MADGVLYQDIVPYEVPPALSALSGPDSGVIELPRAVHWGPQRLFDLDDPDQLRFAYQQLVREGTPEMQQRLLHEQVLRQVWTRLRLPDRCRAAWESAFIDLAA